MVLKLVQFLTLFLTGLLEGLLVGVWFVEHAMLGLSATVYTAVELPKHQFFGPVMPWLMGLTLSAGLLLLLLIRTLRTAAFALASIGVLCIAVLISTTLLVNVPINAEIMTTWSVAAPPANWEQVRDQWNLFHSIRTVLAILAFGCQIVAVLMLQPSGQQHRLLEALPSRPA